jgi:beta-glucosidase
VHDGDLALIGAPIDFLGENYYSPHVVADLSSPAVEVHVATTGETFEPYDEALDTDPIAQRSPWSGSRDVAFVRKGLPETQMGWEVEPQGLRRVLNRLTDEYDCPPLYVTENGAAYEDHLVDGAVDDEGRTAYLHGHAGAMLDTIADGVDLRGYFLWSLLDNFEWGWGYDRRFGAVHVDFETQVRTPKRSALWYGELARTNVVPPL